MQDKIERDWFKPSKHEVIHYIFLIFFYIFSYFHIFFVITNRDFYCMLGNQPELYLYGHPSLDLIDNRQILLSTIKYVKD